MKKLSLLLFLLLNLFSTTSQAVLRELYILCNSQGEYIYLLGDYHSRNKDVDLSQLNYLIFLLQERAISTSDPMDIFIEQTSKKIPPCVLAHLSNFEDSFGSANVYDIDIRLICNAAFNILNPKINPHNLFDEIYTDREVDYENVTFVDFLGEFDRLLEEVKAKQSSEHFCASEIFNAYLLKIEGKRDKLLQALEERDFAPSDKILDAAKKLFDKHGPVCYGARTDRYRFHKVILKVPSAILELSILQRLSKSSSNKKMVIAGENHISSLISLLQAKGFYIRNRIYGRFDDYKFFSLQEEQLKAIISLPPKFPLSLLSYIPCTIF